MALSTCNTIEGPMILLGGGAIGPDGSFSSGVRHGELPLCGNARRRASELKQKEWSAEALLICSPHEPTKTGPERQVDKKKAH